MISSADEDKRVDTILRNLESLRELIKQDPKPNVRRSLQRKIREAEEQLRDLTEEER